MLVLLTIFVQLLHQGLDLILGLLHALLKSCNQVFPFFKLIVSFLLLNGIAIDKLLEVIVGLH